jgi:hypothetical protein
MPGGQRPASFEPGSDRMRLILDIDKTLEGQYEGRLTVPGTATGHDFVGVLEMLAILEQQLQPGTDDYPGQPYGTAAPTTTQQADRVRDADSAIDGRTTKEASS